MLILIAFKKNGPKDMVVTNRDEETGAIGSEKEGDRSGKSD